MHKLYKIADFIFNICITIEFAWFSHTLMCTVHLYLSAVLIETGVLIMLSITALNTASFPVCLSVTCLFITQSLETRKAHNVQILPRLVVSHDK